MLSALALATLAGMPGTTPRVITPEIAAFAASLSASGPIFVPVEPQAECEIGNCFYNVPDVVKAKGGSTVFGWIIWERRGVYLEAEHHAVWMPPLATTPIDVTPKEDRERRILFVPDPSAIFDGRLARANVRLALIDDPVVHRFLAAGDAIDASRVPAGKGRVGRSEAAMWEAARALQALNEKFP